MKKSGLELPLQVQQTRSAFHPHAQRNSFRRRDARLQSGFFARWLLLRLSAMISQNFN
jgi:hypothetical protein